MGWDVGVVGAGGLAAWDSFNIDLRSISTQPMALAQSSRNAHWTYTASMLPWHTLRQPKSGSGWVSYKVEICRSRFARVSLPCSNFLPATATDNLQQHGLAKPCWLLYLGDWMCKTQQFIRLVVVSTRARSTSSQFLFRLSQGGGERNSLKSDRDLLRFQDDRSRLRDFAVTYKAMPR